jgi:hypothetical protein
MRAREGGIRGRVVTLRPVVGFAQRLDDVRSPSQGRDDRQVGALP